MHIPLEQIVAILLQYKYALLIPISAVEGPIITILVGFLSSTGLMNIFLAYASVVTGDLIGDCIYYAVGRYGRKSFIRKWGHFIGMAERRIERLESHFKKSLAKTIIFGKIAHGLGTFILFGAGVAKVPFGRFFWYNIISTLPKSLILILMGFYFGQAYVKIGRYLDYTAIGAIVLGFVFMIGYIIIAIRAEKLSE